MDNAKVDLPIKQPLTGVAMHAFLALAAESHPEKIPLAISRCICHALLADMCYLVSTPENGKITCFDGFNRVKEEILPGTVFSLDRFSEIGQSYLDGQPRLENHPETLNPNFQETLSILGLNQAAPFCFVPITTPEKEMLGALLILSPYTRREWSQADITQIIAISDSASQILTRVIKTFELEERLKVLEEQPKQKLKSPGHWIREATGETIPIEDGLPETQVQPSTRTGLYFTPSSDQSEIYRTENDLLLNEITNLHLQIERLTANTSNTASNPTDTAAQQAFEQIRNDLHGMLAPLSAITGYHDLLVSESVGSLTTMQQRFLERIHSAAEKLHTYIDQIDQVVQSDITETSFSDIPQSVSLQKVIEETFAEYQQLIHERDLEVRLSSPADLPNISGTEMVIRPVINKILNSLLSITPNKSKIQSKLSIQMELNGKQNILWKVTVFVESDILPGKEIDEFSEYLQENIFSLAERLNCQLWMDATVHTERQVNLLFQAV